MSWVHQAWDSWNLVVDRKNITCRLAVVMLTDRSSQVLVARPHRQQDRSLVDALVCLPSVSLCHLATHHSQGHRQVKRCGADTRGERAEREPVMGSRGTAEPLVRRSGGKAPWSWKPFSFWCPNHDRLPTPSSRVKTLDLHQSQERLLVKVGGHVHPSPPRGDALDHSHHSLTHARDFIVLFAFSALDFSPGSAQFFVVTKFWSHTDNMLCTLKR